MNKSELKMDFDLFDIKHLIGRITDLYHKKNWSKSSWNITVVL